MSLLDIVLIILIGIFGWVGSMQRPVRLFSISIGTLAGLLFGIVVYSRFAFLATDSIGRTIILALVTIAASLICYDMVLTLGKHLEKHYRKRIHVRLTTAERVISAVGAIITTFWLGWIGLNIFGSAAPVTIQRYMQDSHIITFTRTHIPAPSIFQKVANILAPFKSPQAFIGNEPTFSGTIQGNDFLTLDAAVARSSNALFKVKAWGCNATSKGSSFMISKQAVVTNAHVVAGATRIAIEDRNNSQSYPADVILFDPGNDLAVLRVNTELSPTPLAFSKAKNIDSVASILGFPGGETFSDNDAIIVEQLRAKGYDIYDKQVVTRSIYALRANVVAGGSGSALINSSGDVIGLVFGHSKVQNHTAYALTATQIAPAVQEALERNTVTSSGSCTM